MESPSHWSELEEINFDLTPMALGSPKFDVEEAVASIGGAAGHFESRSSSRSDLFLVGELGRFANYGPEATLRAVSGALASSALGITDSGDNLRLESCESTKTGSHLRARQVSRAGLPICGSEINFHLDPDGVVYAITGRPFPEALERSTSSVHPWDDEQLLRQLARHLRTEPDMTSASFEPMDILVDGKLRSGVRVMFHVPRPFATWSALMCDDGRLLSVFNVASAARANVYDVNPLRSGVRVLDLTNLLSTVTLDGQYATISRDNGRVAAQGGDFLFSVTEEEFDEPNLYYCLDRAYADFRSLSQNFGSTIAGTLRRTEGIVHAAAAPDSAFYEPLSGRLYFGDIQIDANKRYTSRSLDIVLHEYGHVLSDSICRLGRTTSNTSARALSEGFSDYFAASILGDPRIGDYYMNNANGLRRCDKPLRFPRGYAGDEHAVGEVWACYLWSLRSVLGDVADQLAFESLYYLGPWRTIRQGVDALLAADLQLYPATGGGSLHEATISDLFDDRRPSP